MFGNIISRSPLTSRIADTVFQNISGEPYCGDISFLCTMRALMDHRIGEGDRIVLRFSHSMLRASEISDMKAVDVVSCITDNIDMCGSGLFIVHSFRGLEEDIAANMKAVEEGFAKLYSRYSKLEKITSFFKKSFQVACFINPEKKNVIFFVDRMNLRRMHFLQIAILPSMPWYFNKETGGVSEEEMRLIESLKSNDADDYLACVNEIASKYDFRAIQIRNMLDGFESKIEMAECSRIRETIASIDSEIRRLNGMIGDYYESRRESCAKLLGLETKISQSNGQSEIMEYFICNNKLHLEYVGDTYIDFCVADDLSYYDQDMIERILDNKYSFVYENARGDIDKAQMKKLIRAIFIDELLHIKFCAAYRLNLTRNVEAKSSHEFPPEFQHCMPNPHINKYRCMGGYESTINEQLIDGNYIGAIEQCIASCKSLNWGDSTVMGSFMRNLYTEDCRIIRMPDGKFMTPYEAVQWLEAQETENEEEEKQEEA